MLDWPSLMLGFTTKITCLLEVHTFGLIIDLNIISQAHYKAQFKHVTFRWSVHRRQICFPIPIKWSLTLINLKILFSSALVFSCVSDTFDIWSRSTCKLFGIFRYIHYICVFMDVIVNRKQPNYSYFVVFSPTPPSPALSKISKCPIHFNYMIRFLDLN